MTSFKLLQQHLPPKLLQILKQLQPQIQKPLPWIMSVMVTQTLSMASIIFSPIPPTPGTMRNIVATVWGAIWPPFTPQQRENLFMKQAALNFTG